jgi:signal transduction histidine kinase
LPQVACDDVQIEYVVQELLAHAQAVSGSDPGAHARLTLRSAHGGVEVWVEDQGACLEAELIDRIFDPFVEGDSDSVGAGQGGLRECLRIIEEHGGEFVVQPGAGQGNRISFVLPVHTPA